MQHALKLALVDPRHLEYKELNKQADLQSKTAKSIEMRDILNDPSLPDDEKVKLYRNTLGRFLNVSDKVPTDQPLPPVHHDQPPINADVLAGWEQKQSQKRKRKNRKASATPAATVAATAIRKSSRPKKPPVPHWISFLE
jgi:hypothetical protein